MGSRIERSFVDHADVFFIDPVWGDEADIQMSPTSTTPDTPLLRQSPVPIAEPLPQQRSRTLPPQFVLRQPSAQVNSSQIQQAAPLRKESLTPLELAVQAILARFAAYDEKMYRLYESDADSELEPESLIPAKVNCLPMQRSYSAPAPVVEPGQNKFKT